MMRYIIYIITVIFVLFAASCSKHDCFKSSGSVQSEHRYLDEFDTIYINDYFQVALKTDTINKVEVEAGSQLIKNIKTDVSNNTLTINDLNACKFIKGYKAKKLTISTNDISKIIVNDGVELTSVDTLKFNRLLIRYFSDIGSCDLTVDCKRIIIDVWYASGEYKVRGKTNYLTLSMNSISSAYAYDIEADNVYATSNTLGDIHLGVKKYLYANIKNEGNIYYKGNPSSIKLVDSLGTGKLIKVYD